MVLAPSMLTPISANASRTCSGVGQACVGRRGRGSVVERGQLIGRAGAEEVHHGPVALQTPSDGAAAFGRTQDVGGVLISALPAPAAPHQQPAGGGPHRPPKHAGVRHVLEPLAGRLPEIHGGEGPEAQPGGV